MGVLGIATLFRGAECCVEISEEDSDDEEERAAARKKPLTEDSRLNSTKERSSSSAKEPKPARVQRTLVDEPSQPTKRVDRWETPYQKKSSWGKKRVDKSERFSDEV